MRGTVVTWIPAKGFGFIKPALGRRDVFVHASDVAHGPIFQSAAVEFSQKPNPKPAGLPLAIDVKVMP